MAAGALYTGVVADLPHESGAQEVPWWILAVAFAAAEMWVVHFHFRRSSHSFSLGELPLVFGLLFLSPHELLFASVLGSAVPLIVNREIPPVKVFFNVAQFTLGTCVALTVFELLAVSRDALDPGVWAATLLAVFATALVADVTIGATIQLAEGGLRLRTRLEMLAINWGVASVNGVFDERLALATLVAIDDFGTAYSSLAYLRSLPIDTIKIPKTLIDGVGGSTKDDMFARAVIDFGSKLDLTVVAVGVERAEQAAILRSLGCDLAQGFYFAEPAAAPPAALASLAAA